MSQSTIKNNFFLEVANNFSPNFLAICFHAEIREAEQSKLFNATLNAVQFYCRILLVSLLLLEKFPSVDQATIFECNCVLKAGMKQVPILNTT